MSTSYINYIMRMRDGVTRKLKGVRMEASRADKEIKGMKGSLTSLVAIAGTAFAANQLLTYGAELQKVEKSFEVLTGSAGTANSMLKEVGEFAKSTNFGKMGLAQSAKDLLTYGVQAEKVMPTLRMLGDVSLGNQEKLRLLSYAYAQVQGAGKLMGQDLLQMINSGFNPLQVIADKTGKSMGELRDMMRKGAISSEMVTEAMKVATSAGGRFFNGAMALADTGAGRFDRMKETAFELAQTFGKDLLNALIPVFDKMTALFEFMTRHKDTIIVVAQSVGVLAGGFTLAATAARAYTLAQGALNLVMAANPIGLILAGIAALVTGLVAAYKRFDKFREVVDTVWHTLKQFGTNIKNMVLNPIQTLKTLLGNTIAPFMEAIGLAREGNFIGAAKALGKGMLNVIPVGMAANTLGMMTQGIGSYDTQKLSMYRSAADSFKFPTKDTEGSTSKAAAPNFLAMMSQAGEKAKAGSLKSGVDSIVGRAPKTFNITIEKMTGIESLNTTNIKEGVQDLEESIKRVLLNALNDAQNIAIS